MNDVVTPKDGPDLKALLQNNRNWAEKMQRENPEFFPTLAAQQKPKYLWIGCSDSRVPANQITGLLPGEIFVHRNVANIIRADDANCQSVVEFAVSALQVEHIIVCGHYQCGGVEAAMRGNIVGTAANYLESATIGSVGFAGGGASIAAMRVERATPTPIVDPQPSHPERLGQWPDPDLARLDLQHQGRITQRPGAHRERSSRC
jgi:hypothetical protein